MIEYRRPWARQPNVAARPARSASDLVFLEGRAVDKLSQRRSIVNLVDGTVFGATFAENAGAAPVVRPTPYGLATFPAVPANGFGLAYSGFFTGLNGLNQLTLLTWFQFLSDPGTSGQELNFRADNQHTLDIFGRTASSVTWGADWAGAWNGSSQQTTSGLNNGDFVCIGASILPGTGGARFWVNGRFSGTKTGSAFTTASIQINFQRSTFPILGRAAFKRSLSDSEMARYTRNPWLLFEPRSIVVPVSAAAPTLPTLTALTPINVTGATALQRYQRA